MNKLYLVLWAAFALPMAMTSEAAECNPEEVGYVASFSVKPESAEQFEAAISKLAATVRAEEPGALFYAPYKGADGRYFMMERYQDEAARKAHGTSEKVRALFPTLGPHMAGPPDIQPVSAVCK